ncbi:MAG: 2-hydroxyacid dehydrogenase [Candidatus Diapherotrites archaeon]|nr:2-hydroxyacid dehydrogenase [Candidatus Diapherotrites archaeon]
MRFRKLVLYDLRQQPLEKEFVSALKGLAGEVKVVFAEKEYAGTLRAEHLTGADALVVRLFDDYPNKLFDNGALRYIGTMHTAYGHFDLGFLKEKGITLCSVPQYATESIAELEFSVLLNIARQTCEALNFVRKGKWGFENFMGWGLKGKTIGIVGLGAIGSRVAEIALAFGMNVCYYSRTRKIGWEHKGVRYRELDDLLRRSDVVSLNCELNEQTKKILNRERVAMLKRGAVLLNPSPHQLCDISTVMGAAKKGKIFAWFEDIEDAGLRKKMAKIKNILLTPNYGWMTAEAQQNLRKITIENTRAF